MNPFKSDIPQKTIKKKNRIFEFFFSPEAEINACAGREAQIKNVVEVSACDRKWKK